ncbi:MAG TPA: Rrf2 family transcriptional regulator [Polyangiaceae bacterium]|jgi:Rrf2 family protein|nr:Rrf2 family transcriptional regulator [Polyangiaceae bacterium]
MKLGEGVEQAIHSVLLLAGLPVDGVLPASALAEYFGVSSSYLLKHLQALAGAGLLLSVPGPKGGYRLAREPAHISLLEIVLAIEGPEPAFRCSEIRQRGPSPIAQHFHKAPCGVTVAMLRAEKAYRAELEKISIAALSVDPRSALGAALKSRSCEFLETHQRRTLPRA